MSRREYMAALRKLADKYRSAGNDDHASNLDTAADEISAELLREAKLET